MERLWAVYDMFTRFVHKTTKRNKREVPCGCIRRGDGQYVRYCTEHNKRTGTHGHVGGFAPPEEL